MGQACRVCNGSGKDPQDQSLDCPLCDGYGSVVLAAPPEKSMPAIVRQHIPSAVRFEVLKRDSFRCQYCGQSAPDVVLHIDHMHPLAEGGSDDIANLITSCKDCNLGKGARLLDDRSVMQRQRQQMEELQERREQLEMMMRWREGLSQIDEDKLQIAVEKFEEIAGCGLTQSGRASLQKVVKKYHFNLVLDAIEAAAHYLEVGPEGAYTQKSQEKALAYVGRICAVKAAGDQKPYLKDLFYVRGILRKRISYCDDRKALQWLEQAYLRGASVESLKEFVLSVKHWTAFRTGIETFIIEADKSNATEAQ